MDTSIISTWHYTFSALAQSAAAILGITIAFAIFKLKGVSQAISNYRGRITDILVRLEQHPKPILRGGYKYYGLTIQELIYKYQKVKFKINNSLEILIDLYQGKEQVNIGSDVIKQKVILTEWCDNAKYYLEYNNNIIYYIYNKLRLSILLAFITFSISILLLIYPISQTRMDNIVYYWLIFIAIVCIILLGFCLLLALDIIKQKEIY